MSLLGCSEMWLALVYLPSIAGSFSMHHVMNRRCAWNLFRVGEVMQTRRYSLYVGSLLELSCGFVRWHSLLSAFSSLEMHSNALARRCSLPGSRSMEVQECCFAEATLVKKLDGHTYNVVEKNHRCRSRAPGKSLSIGESLRMMFESAIQRVEEHCKQFLV